MRGPNPEQQKAIEHQGGVLLSAGAGSGKTFVLVEHVIYLINNFIDKNSSLPQEDFLFKLKSHFSSIVLMTFTKKAAGELALRLQARVSERADLEESQHWQCASEAVNSMFVGTIHGFCNRLIKQGFFIDADPNAEVINEMQFVTKIESIFEKWYLTICKSKYEELAKIFCANKSSIQTSIIQIFSDPSLRYKWKNLSVDELINVDFKKFFDDYFFLGGLSNLSDINTVLSQYESEQKKSWYGILSSFSKLPPLHDIEQYQEYIEFFQGYKTLRGPTKNKGFDEAIEIFDSLKILRKFLRDNEESIFAYQKEKNNIYSNWCHSLKNLMEYVEEHYKEIGGITFSDLEYIVLTGCAKKEVTDRISATYNYFIVDEFQDTSSIQYEILRRMSLNDLNRVFCVGDVKQAIYGFRGGELGVFLDCQKEIEQNLTMTNNYRSLENIIEFNNVFFEKIFRLGMGYTGSDLHSVDVKHQTVPIAKDFLGEVYSERIEITDQEKLSSAELNSVEAAAIIKRIGVLQKEYPAEDICILYRKLAPASVLIEKLLENENEFTAQVKVPFSEDPLLGIFVRLLEEQLENEPCRRLTLLIIEGYYQLLGFSIPTSLDLFIDQFFEDIKVIGVIESYRKLIFKTGVSNSNYSNNFRLLETADAVANGCIESLWLNLTGNASKSYSIDFQKGLNASQIRIMTAHASKGLEFDHVILGGIHNNGLSIADRSYFGSFPGSFRWKVDGHQKKAFKSLQYIIESEIKKQKEFSESKRLFYVAATRAVKSLSWNDIVAQKGPCSVGKDSWINAIRVIEDKDGAMATSTAVRSLEISSLVSTSSTLPLFHRDRVGLEQAKEIKHRKLLTVSELSVTRLASVVDCPRKFYLQNICRLEPLEQEYKVEKEDSLIEGSSAVRGTEIHDQISVAILNDFCVEPSQKVGRDQEALSWILEELSKYDSTHQLISEQPLKFSFFGLMMSGIPDLVMVAPNECQIWDFKTGRYGEDKCRSYWFQLMVYGHAISEKFKLKKDDKISLVLAFVDEKKLVTKKFSLDELDEKLIMEWEKLGSFSQVNRDHCSSCQFSGFCLD